MVNHHMFGYLKLYENGKSAKLLSVYRRHYCSLCHSLWTFYGFRSRFLLSYDLTFLCILLKLPVVINTSTKTMCIRKREISEEESWKRMAAISLLMISQKLEDDIHDENSIKAKCVKRLFEKSFKKARQDYPSVYSRMLSDFKEFNRGEETNASVFELAEAFSDIMKNALNSMFQCTDAELMIIDYVAQWLYFIDAVDDLDEDITKGRFNPFTFMAKSKRQLITERKAYIEGFVDS